MARKANRRNGPAQGVAPAKTETGFPKNGGRSAWAYQQIGLESYAFLVVGVFAQVATILITWPAWQVRADPPNLPWLEATPQFSCGWLLVLTLILTLLTPRRFGLATHLIALGVAIGMDQFRCQPQILGLTFMMAACVWPAARRVCVWFLVSMWLWAGIHKFVSADWFLQISFNLLSETGIRARNLHVGFAALVAAAECGLGVMAWLRPKKAAIGCIVLHLGIAIFLLIIRWNLSVIPWNICTAIVGAWLLKNANVVGEIPDESRLAIPGGRLEKLAVAVLLIVPIGLYAGLVRHCFSHALYSGNLPAALVTREHELEMLEVWDDLNLPFPNVQKSYLDYFKLTAESGEKLHIRDPRAGFKSRYFGMDQLGRCREISVNKFFQLNDHGVEGVALDDPRKIHQLKNGNATMLKRSQDEMIYAVKFDPQGFQPKLLELLGGLPNLEQIQLADCELIDEDLKQISGLPKLIGIGLGNTAVTDEGLSNLKDLPSLIMLEHEGTAITADGLKSLGIPDSR